MVKLRLRRRGRKARPIYDIVAMDSRKRRDGEHLEVVGQYNPITKPSTIVLKHDRALYWLNVGAQPTDRVRDLLSVKGVLLQQYMERKGASAQEVQDALVKHEASVQQRVQRKITKKAGQSSRKTVEAAEAAKVAAEAAKVAELAAKEAEKAAAAAAKEAEKAAAEAAKEAAKAAAEAPVAEAPAEAPAGE
jgi:small subunit ribosomal protein S16